MKISNTESTLASQIAPVGTSAVSPASSASKVGGGTGPAASVEISPQAQALASARAEAASYVPVVNAVPDRTSKINELKSSIAAGTYHVSSQDIAAQIHRRIQADTIK